MTIRQDLLSVNNGQSIRTFNVDGAHINAKPIQSLSYKEFTATGLQKIIDAVDSDIFISEIQAFSNIIPRFLIQKISDPVDPNFIPTSAGRTMTKVLLPKGYSLVANCFNSGITPSPQTIKFLLFFEPIYLTKE